MLWALATAALTLTGEALAGGAIVSNRLGMRLVYIPPGSFEMGSPPTE
jgi:formylglycine-generating enzyme required for sulfatase activity